MCVIIGLPKGKNINYEMLKAATLNNRDGYGLVFNNGGKLEVIKEVLETGNDPELVQKRLEQSKDYHRYLHLRYNTVGATNEENAHPFTVYKAEDNHHVEFMHNGTLHDWKPGTNLGKSDTYHFANDFLSPLLYRFTGDNGVADIEDPFLAQLIEKFFGFQNRGVLISNKQDPLFLGKWKTIKSEEGDDIAVSNDDYFKHVQTSRGSKYDKSPTTFQQQQQTQGYGGHGHMVQGGASTHQRSEGSATNAGETHTNVVALPNPASKDKEVVLISEVNKNKPAGRLITPKEIEDLITLGTDTIEDDAISYFAWMLPKELQHFTKLHPVEMAALFEHVCMRYVELAEQLEETNRLRDKAVDKGEKASNLIATLQNEIVTLKNQVDFLAPPNNAEKVSA